MLDSLIAFALLGEPALAAPPETGLAAREAHHRELLSCDRLVGHWLQEDEYLALYNAMADSRQVLEALRPMPFSEEEFPKDAADLRVGDAHYGEADLARLHDRPAEADVREAYLVLRPHCMRLIGYF
ncbi:hypothetical protein [Halomonas sp. PGE1]|uniref:hypothetical protein n=1 Tax=Halomonas sp. PGE1 TaxID=2730360 RepID=UPI00147372FC|nr:hypothetical protein [Halomonas sp. PGE1]QJQ98118.1 hypothetical protein HIR79_05000 [Halomonas sp. PGE1]